jgi:hypothetical protein
MSCLATCVERTEHSYCPQIWMCQFGGVTCFGRGRGAAGAPFLDGCGAGVMDDVVSGFAARPSAPPSPMFSSFAAHSVFFPGSRGDLRSTVPSGGGTCHWHTGPQDGLVSRDIWGSAYRRGMSLLPLHCPSAPKFGLTGGYVGQAIQAVNDICIGRPMVAHAPSAWCMQIAGKRQRELKTRS